MRNIGFLRRFGLKALAWLLADTDNSKTHGVNAHLYMRAIHGRPMISNFTHPQISVGDHTYGLRPESFFPYHPDDRVRIGKFCSIADGVKFIFGHHPTDRVSTFPFDALCFGDAPHADSESKGDIEIGNDVWIGASAIILSGVIIGHGAVIAAGAVVTKSVEPYSLVGGVPARFIRHRIRKDQAEALLAIRWWDWPLQKILENRDLFYEDADKFIKSSIKEL